MDCDKAREIMNRVIDGEDHPAAGDAYQHINDCDRCAKWYLSMQNMLSTIASANCLPYLDLSAAIMTSLPERHPAAEGMPFRDLRRLAVWIASTSVFLSAVVVLLLVFVLRALSGDSVTQVISRMSELCGTCTAVASKMVADLCDLGLVALRTLGTVVICLYPSIMRLLLLDVALLLGIAAMCSRKRKHTGTSIMV